jgi:MerR family transcriptional regulator, light-induced transcriptional regulator
VDGNEAGYLRIGELARRTDVSPELLRAWERRYGLLRPARSQGGFRLYTAADEARIQRMREHLARGVAAAEAARLAVEADPLDQAPSEGSPTRASGLRSAEGSGAAAPHPVLELAAGELAVALDQFDDERAHAVLDRLLAAYATETVLRDLLIPYLHDLGERWERGDLSIAREHFASNLLRGRLLGLARGWGQGHGPAAVLACLPGEQHDLGLLTFGITLYRRGWRIIYLGADTPIATIRDAMAGVTPRLVVLAATMPEGFPAHAGAIADLVDQTTVAIGGAGATVELAGRTGAHLLDQDPVSAAERLDQVLPGIWEPQGDADRRRLRRPATPR